MKVKTAYKTNFNGELTPPREGYIEMGAGSAWGLGGVGCGRGIQPETTRYQFIAQGSKRSKGA